MTIKYPTRGRDLLLAQLQKLGWNQLHLGAELGVGSSTISRWFTGDRRPDLKYAIRLRQVLGIPVEAWEQPSRRRAA